MTDALPPAPIPPPTQQHAVAAPAEPAGPMIAGRSSKEWTTIITLILGVAGGGSYGMAKMFQPEGYEVLVADVAALKAASAEEQKAEAAMRDRLTRLEASSSDLVRSVDKLGDAVMKVLTRPRPRRPE